MNKQIKDFGPFFLCLLISIQAFSQTEKFDTSTKAVISEIGKPNGKISTYGKLGGSAGVTFIQLTPVICMCPLLAPKFIILDTQPFAVNSSLSVLFLFFVSRSLPVLPSMDTTKLPSSRYEKLDPSCLLSIFTSIAAVSSPQD